MTFESRAASMNRDEVVALLKAHLELERSHQQLQHAHADLARQVAWFKRQLFGEKSERRVLDPSGRQLTLGEMLRSEVTPVPEIEVPGHRRRRVTPNDADAVDSELRFDPTVPVCQFSPVW